MRGILGLEEMIENFLIKSYCTYCVSVIYFFLLVFFSLCKVIYLIKAVFCCTLTSSGLFLLHAYGQHFIFFITSKNILFQKFVEFLLKLFKERNL